MTASSITIVTKNTPQSYTGGTSAAAKGNVLSVLEVDSNFINIVFLNFFLKILKWNHQSLR